MKIEQKEKLKLDSIAYKFREWKSDYDKDVLYKQHLFFPHPDELNDPFDFDVELAYDQLTDEEWKIKIRQLVIHGMREDLSTGAKNEKDVKIEVEKQFKGGQHKDKDFVKNFQSKMLDEHRKNSGVLSLTKGYSNLLLWSYYAYSHKGICFGFHLNSLFNESGARTGEVIYGQGENKEIIKPHIDQETMDTTYMQQSVHKSFHWKHEEEIRLVITKNFIESRKPSNIEILRNGIIFKYEPKTLREIILGLKMSTPDRNEIFRYLSSNSAFDHVKVFRTTKLEGKYAIKRIELPNCRF